MFRFQHLSDSALQAEYTLFNEEAADLLAYFGPAALAQPSYCRLTSILSTITTEQQRRVAATARALAA